MFGIPWSLPGTNVELHVVRSCLVRGAVKRFLDVAAQIDVLGIADYADDFQILLPLRSAVLQMLANRILRTAVMSSREARVDQDDQRFTVYVLLGKVTTGEQGNSDRRKISGVVRGASTIRGSV